MLSFWRFTIYLGGVLFLVFGIHVFFYQTNRTFFRLWFQLPNHHCFFFWLLIRSRNKSETLGFVFLAISGIKFLFFFLLYRPFSITLLEKKALFLSFLFHILFALSMKCIF